MKKIIVFAFFAFLGLQVYGQSNLPTTSIKTMKGSSVPFNEIIKPGKVTMISFWATWCVPCKKEIKAVRDKLKDWHKAADFEYITISEDDSRATAMVRSYARSQGWGFPAYQDPNNDLKRSLAFQNVPFTIIINKKGEIVYRHTSYSEGSENDLFEKVKELAEK